MAPPGQVLDRRADRMGRPLRLPYHQIPCADELNGSDDRPVAEQLASSAERTCLQQFQPDPFGAGLEERMALAEGDRNQTDTILIEQPVMGQTRREVGASEDEEIAVLPVLLEVRHRLADIPLQQRTIGP